MYIPIQIFRIECILDGTFYLHLFFTVINLVEGKFNFKAAEYHKNSNPLFMLGIHYLILWATVKLITDLF